MITKGHIYLMILRGKIGGLGYPVIVPGPHIWPSASGPRAHKCFNQFNLLLVKLQSLWSCAHNFQWFTGYLNHDDLLISHVHVLKKLPYCLMCLIVLLFNCLTWFVDFIPCPTDKYMFKVDIKCSMASYWCFYCWFWP